MKIIGNLPSMLEVVVLRSVVLGAHHLKMADSVRLIKQTGATDVASVRAAGNLVFRSRKSPPALVAALEAGCERLYGKPTEVVAKTAAEWRALMGGSPSLRSPYPP